MSITREQKADIVKGYTALIQKSQGMILIDYKGLNMKGMHPLRVKVREAGGELHVVKNTLVRLALQQAGLSVPESLITQSTAIGFAFTDVPGVAKALTTFAKDNEVVKVKAGVLGSKSLSVKEVEALADLPPLPVVRAQMLGLLTTPATRLAGVVAGSVRQVVNVVKAYSEKTAPAAA